METDRETTQDGLRCMTPMWSDDWGDPDPVIGVDALTGEELRESDLASR